MNNTAQLRRRQSTLGPCVLIVSALVLIAVQSRATQAQWATNGNNINNTNTGNVGVGTTTPAQKLDVAGAIASSGTTVIDASRNIVNAGTGNFSGTITGSALNSYVAYSSNAVITPSGSPAIGFNAQRFDQYVDRSAIGGIFAQYVWPNTPTSTFYSYGAWARAQSVPGGIISENIGVVADSFAGKATYSAGVKASALMTAEYYVNGTVYGVDASAGRATGITLTQGNSIYGVRSIASGGSTYGTGDTVYGLYTSGSGGSLNYGVYSAAGTNYFNAKVGIGTNTPSTELHVIGNVTVSGNIAAKYQDVAEWVPAAHALPPGTVVTLNPTQSNLVEASSKPYDTGVAGVISAQPGITLGECAENKVLVATTGRVKVKVDATNAPIQIGDLLVTSEQKGIAMKSLPVDVGGVKIHRPGTIIGKALEPLAKGQGEILVLLSLQ